MTKHTPTTKEVRAGFAYDEWDTSPGEEEKPRRQAFDRWLNEIRAEAWDEGVRKAFGLSVEDDYDRSTRTPGDLDNPYRTG